MSDYLVEGKNIKEILLQLAEQGNKPFTASLHPGVENVLGIKIPHLRQLARKIAKSDPTGYLSHCDTFYMEERLLHGLVLGYILPSEDLDIYLQQVTDFVKIINSWSVCDTFSFAGGNLFVMQHDSELWEYLKRWMKSEAEYEIRFGVVMAKKYFINDKYINELLHCMDTIRHEGYYVKMAVAWTVSECFVKYPKQTGEFLLYNQLDDFTYNKSLQKIVESYRVDAATKKQIRTMKRLHRC